MFLYRTFVFELRSTGGIDIGHYFRKFTNLISDRDEDCEACKRDRDRFHYHGLVEYHDDFASFIDVIFREVRKVCITFKSEDCPSSVLSEYLARIGTALKYVWFCGRSAIKESFINNSHLILPEGLEQSELKLSYKEQSRKEEVVKLFTCLILKSRIFDCGKLISHFDNYKPLSSLLKSNDLDCFNYALSTAERIVISKSITQLCKDFPCESENYLSPEASKTFVLRWCSFQNINPKRFVDAWLNCMDKKLEKRNVLYLHAAEYSGMSYITESIRDACIFSCCISQETTGNPYVWQNCMDKRLIVLKDPIFDATCSVDVLYKVLKGSGTYIRKRNSYTPYLLQTPVVLISHSHGWKNNTDLETRIKGSLVDSFIDLRKIAIPDFKLHPAWLISLATGEYVIPEETIPRSIDDRESQSHSCSASSSRTWQQGIQKATSKMDVQQDADDSSSKKSEIPIKVQMMKTCSQLYNPREDHERKDKRKRKRFNEF